MLDRHDIEYVRIAVEGIAGEPAARRAAQEHGHAAAARMASRQAFRRDEAFKRKLAARAAARKETNHG